MTARPPREFLESAPDLMRLSAVSYHEAGHATIAERLGYRIEAVEVSPDGGFCRTFDSSAARSPADWLDVLVAGAAAESKFTGAWDWASAENDLAHGIGVAAQVRGWSSRTRNPRARVGEAAVAIRRLFDLDDDLWHEVMRRADTLAEAWLSTPPRRPRRVVRSAARAPDDDEHERGETDRSLSPSDGLGRVTSK